jgi:hypothetical protein
MATCLDIITYAMRQARILGAGKDPKAAESEEGMVALQSLYDQWRTAACSGGSRIPTSTPTTTRKRASATLHRRRDHADRRHCAAVGTRRLWIGCGSGRLGRVHRHVRFRAVTRRIGVLGQAVPVQSFTQARIDQGPADPGLFLVPSIAYGSSAYKRTNGNFPELKLINMYVEQAATSENQVALVSRPGLGLIATNGSGPINGLFSKKGTFGGDVFSISGTALYRGTVAVTTGTIAGTGPASFAGSDLELLVTRGSTMRSYKAAGIADVAFPDGAVSRRFATSVRCSSRSGAGVRFRGGSIGQIF